MLVAVISDTHIPRGARRLPHRCVDELSRADLIVHAGDLTSVAFLRTLQELGPPVHAVHGNMDEPTLREQLPATLVVEAGGSRIGVVHDAGPRAGREARLAALFPGCAAAVYGHTHQPQAERHGGMWILNPGSPTERRRSPWRSMILLELAGAELRPQLLALAGT